MLDSLPSILITIRSYPMSEAAAWALTGTIVGAFLSGGTNWLMQSRQFKHAEKMHTIANQGREAVKAILLEMLNHKSYTDRSFDALRERVGGFSDDELRQLLHEIGARKTSRDDGSEEWWYLESRRQERIAKKANNSNLNK